MNKRDAATGNAIGAARWKAVTGSATFAAAVFALGYGCTGNSAPAAVSAGPPVKVTSQTPEPSSPVGKLPADRTKPSSAPCATVVRPAGWSKIENAKSGDSSWRASFDSDTSEVAGYVNQVSAACGDTLDLHLSGYVSSASVTAYRMGWYGGAGGRVVWSASHVPVSASPVKNSGAPTYTVEASWPVATHIPITSAWTPGYYLLIVRAKPHDTGDAIPLIIRDDSAGNGTAGSGSSPLLLQASVLTYQAYNNYGRYSLYYGPKDLSSKRTDRSRVASFDRPYNGSGYQAPFLYDIPLAEEAEKLGLDVDYTTDIDLDQRPSQVAAHKALLIGGHSEYWTRRMYDAALYARSKGTNIGFFGANETYWHARLEPSPSGQDRRMVVYRYANEDPLAKSDPSQATVYWDSPQLQMPEAQIVGPAYGELGADGGAFRVLQPDSWIFAGTGATKDQVLKNSLGGEYDTVKNNYATPPDIDVIAAAPIVFSGQSTMATMSYYTDPSGAGIFAAGMTYWDCQMARMCGDRPVDAGTSKLLAAMTGNVLRTFVEGPAGKKYPSVHRPAPSPQALISTAVSQSDVGIGPPKTTEG
ncbi:N,N-dimethylformamidase beta subunit family domain-containing protein [Catenulispora rubra]|uniref:N,N-dimethylformamidase beta subunit family domain-containing protein n=1 Tax=Catenulispora rubra TaxID=280293 RepID=UPI0018927CF0|nr:N,N-dimethylformamidase beta subunit family domain-containing protein [Catenulispora rubra]